MADLPQPTATKSITEMLGDLLSEDNQEAAGIVANTLNLYQSTTRRRGFRAEDVVNVFDILRTLLGAKGGNNNG